MKKEKAWVWFKGGLQGGYWESGFMASESDAGFILIERADFVSSRVAEWRVKLEPPQDEKQPPNIPENPIWKLN